MARILFLGSAEREEIAIEKISVSTIKSLSGQNRFIRAETLEDAEAFVRGPLIGFIVLDLYKFGKVDVMFVDISQTPVEDRLNLVKLWFSAPDLQPGAASVVRRLMSAHAAANN